MKRRNLAIGVAILVFVGIVLLFSSAFVVSQKDQVLVTRFGKLKRVINSRKDGKEEAGLYFKVPFADTVHRFEKRVLEFDGDPTELATGEKTFIYIDTFARWRIYDPQKFYESVRNIDIALTRLSEVINSSIRVAVNSRRLIEVVRDTNRQFAADVDSIEARGTGAEPEAAAPDIDSEFRVQEGHTKVVQSILLEASRTTKEEYGIEILDVQIKRAMYVAEVRQANESEMVSERARIAQMYRSQGKQESDKIVGSIGLLKSKILSEAYKTAEEIKGEGEAEAARIYAKAYGEDVDFYTFLKSLEIYGKTLGQNSTLVLSTDSELFKYLRRSGALTPEPKGE
jgi:membrane protease subunit HflC